MEENLNKTVTSQELTDRKIKVRADGTVEVTEVVETVYTQSYRDFLSDVRSLQRFREQIEDTLKPDFAEKQQERIKKATEQIDELDPYLRESEKKHLAHQEEVRVKGIADRLKEELAKKDSELNKNYLAAVWDNIKKNDDKVLQHLTDEELARFNKIKVDVLAKSKR